MKKILSIFCASLFLAGCGEPRTLEKTGIITTKGFDLGEKGFIKGTMIVLQVNPEARKKVAIVKGESLTSRGIRIKGNLASSKSLLSGQLRVVLYSEKLARHGISPLTDTLVRDPSVSDLTYLGIVESGEARDLLEVDNPQYPDVGQQLFKEIEHNINLENMPSTTLHETIRDFYSAGSDPVMPLFKKEGNNIKISGMGILKNDRLVGKLSERQTFYIRLLRDRVRNGQLEIPISNHPDGENLTHNKVAVVLASIDSKNKLKLVNKKNLEFSINVKLNARVEEINEDIDFKNPKNFKLIEHQINTSVKKDIEKLVTYCRSKGSDPIGLGEIYRSSVPHSQLTREKWHKMFKNAKVNVKVETTLITTGLIE